MLKSSRAVARHISLPVMEGAVKDDLLQRKEWSLNGHSQQCRIKGGRYGQSHSQEQPSRSLPGGRDT